MRPNVVILLTAAALTNLQAVRAQDVGPIRNPKEHIIAGPEAPQASCADYWGLPTPMFGVDWRDFPPPGVLEETPERYDLGKEDWLLGIAISQDTVEGPRFFTYDESGRVATWAQTWGSYRDPTLRQAKWFYAYDTFGNLVSVTQQLGSATSLSNVFQVIYAYDSEGRMIASERHYWKGAWELLDRARCNYDDTGRLEWRIGEMCMPPSEQNPNPQCQDTDSTGYDYDASGLITRVYHRTRGPVGPWPIPLPARYTYDEAGRLIEKIDTYARERDQWTYDDEGRLQEETVTFLGGRERTRYDYQHASLLTRIANDAWISDLEAWAEDGEVRYEYGPRLDLDVEYRLNGPEFSWKRNSYEYDDRGKLEHGIHEVWTGSDWRKASTDDYVYHESGFLEEYQWTDYVQANTAVVQLRNRIRYGYVVGTGVSERRDDLSQRFELQQNYPNPSGLETTITYTLPQSARAGLRVFDLMGRRVKTLVLGLRSAGRHQVTFETSDLPPGIYFYRLEAGGRVETRRMVVVK